MEHKKANRASRRRFLASAGETLLFGGVTSRSLQADADSSKKKNPQAADVRNFPLQFTRRLELGIEGVGTTVIGRLEGKTILVTQGIRRENGKKYAALEAVDTRGKLFWRVKDDSAGGVNGEYIQWLEGPGFAEPCILWTFFPPAKGGEGLSQRGGLFRASDGKQIHRFDKGSNNPSLAFDFRGRGKKDILYSGQQFVSLFDPEAKKTLWTVSDRVFFCWSYPTILPARLNQPALVVWGSEYNLPGGRSSSMVAVDSKGELRWKYDNVEEDLGSTPVFVADLYRDGHPVFIKNGLDLCAKNNLQTNHIFVFSQEGKLLAKHPSQLYSLGIGDLDNDNHLEAFGVVSHRDGGTNARKLQSARCLDLVTGKEKWSVPLPRIGLPGGNALAADVDGDGKLEAIIADGNPSFYGHLPGENWGSLYVVNAEGRLVQDYSLPTWPRRLMMCDLDDDGLNELIVQTDGSPASLFVFKSRAPATNKTWPLPFGNIAHWGSEHPSSVGKI